MLRPKVSSSLLFFYHLCLISFLFLEQEAVLFSPYLDVQPSAIKKPNLKGQSTTKAKTPLTNRRVSFHQNINEISNTITENDDHADHIERLTSLSHPDSNADVLASPFKSPQKPRDPHSLSMSGKRLSWSVVVNTKVGDFVDSDKAGSPTEDEIGGDDEDDPIQHLVRQSLGGSTPVKSISSQEEMKSWMDDEPSQADAKPHRKSRSSMTSSLLEAVKSNNLESAFEALSDEKIQEASTEEPKLKKKRLSGFKDSLSALTSMK